jgi:hypothetical protein
MDRDTYVISKRSAQLGFGPPEGAKADVYKEANEFCAKQNGQVETVRLRMTNSAYAQPGSVSLQFRCVGGEQTNRSRNALESNVLPGGY